MSDATGTGNAVLLVALLVALLITAVVALARAALRAGRVTARLRAQRAGRGRRGRAAIWILGAARRGAADARACRSRRADASTELAATSARTAAGHPRPAAVPACGRDRRDARHPVRPAARGAARARTSSSRSWRATAGSPSRARPSRPASTACSARAARSSPRTGTRRRARSSPRRPSAGSAGSRTRRCRAASGSTRSRTTAGCSTEDRLTLTRAFHDAGWRTVSVVPSNKEPWDEGKAFYGYDSMVNSLNMGYQGPTFSYARIPDQFTWQHFYDTELAQPHAPVMAEIDFVSSHTPWTPLPHLGAVVGARRRLGVRPAAGAGHRAGRRLAGPEAGAAAVRAVGAVHARHDVLVPAHLRPAEPRARRARRPSAGAGRERSGCRPRRADLDHLEGPGRARRARRRGTGSPACCPSPEAPVWRMDLFRDRFLEAFTP